VGVEELQEREAAFGSVRVGELEVTVDGLASDPPVGLGVVETRIEAILLVEPNRVACKGGGLVAGIMDALGEGNDVGRQDVHGFSA